MTTPRNLVHLGGACSVWLIGWLCLSLSVSANEPLFESRSHPSGDLSSAEISSLIDIHMQQAWQESGVRPAQAATDGEWCRRVFLDLLGRVPTVEELDAYRADRSSDKRRRLTEQLLGDTYAGELSRNWATLWTNILVGRTGGRERRTLINRPGLENYLRQSFANKKPYDQLAIELITATGSTNPDDDDFNGAVNFLIEKLDDNAVQAAAKTAQIFLGTAIQCTQCHDHKFNDYRQNHFWEFNAFFRQARVERPREPGDNNRRWAQLIDRDFAGEGRTLYRDNRKEIFLTKQNGKTVDRDAAARHAAPIYFDPPSKELQVAYPVFLDGTALADLFDEHGPDYGNSGYLHHLNRRHELAKLVVASREFDRAIVNRLWAHFFGIGFTKPFDDMGPHHLPSHPELLDELALAFRQARFDLKSLMQWIVLSEPYALSSRFRRGNKADDPSTGSLPQFSRFYVRQMQAEQLYESLLVVTQADVAVDQSQRDRTKERWLRQFNIAFGTDDAGESTSFNGSITQSLTMMNGDLMRLACSTGSGSFLDKVANDWELSNREKIDYLYRAAVARLPTKAELNACNKLLASRQGNVVSTLQDIWWAMLNSNEFILIH